MFSLCFWFACDYIQRQACMHPWCTRVIMHQQRYNTNVYFKCRSLSVRTWMCTCACAHTCTHTNAYIDHIVSTYMYTRTQAPNQSHTHTCRHTHARINAHMHLHTQIHTWMNTCTWTDTYMHVWNLSAHMRAHASNSYLQTSTHARTFMVKHHTHVHVCSHYSLMLSLCVWFACGYIQRQACMHPWCTRVIMHQLRQHTNVYFKCRSLCVCTWMCTCACAHTCTHMNASIDHIVRTYMYTRTQAHTCIHTRLRTRAYWCLSCDFDLHMTIYNAMPVCTPGALVLSCTNSDRTLMCISSVVVYVCIHEYVHVRACMHACISLCVCARM